MSRRRRARNPLLGRIVVISVAAHAIALPILAHFGAFDKLKKSFGDSKVVMLTTVPDTAKKPELPKPAKKKVAQKAGGAKKASGANHASSNVPKADLPQVVAGSGTGAGGDGPVVEQGSGKAGEIPKGIGGTTTKPPPVVTPPPPVVPPTPVPVPTPVVKAPPAVVKPAPKHGPVYAEVEPVYNPQPEIPDDLRDEPLDKTCTIEFTISPTGTVDSATITASSGVRELDDVALRTAKTWRFKPATEDGAPITGRVRLHVEFKVE